MVVKHAIGRDGSGLSRGSGLSVDGAGVCRICVSAGAKSLGRGGVLIVGSGWCSSNGFDADLLLSPWRTSVGERTPNAMPMLVVRSAVSRLGEEVSMYAALAVLPAYVLLPPEMLEMP